MYLDIFQNRVFFSTLKGKSLLPKAAVSNLFHCPQEYANTKTSGYVWRVAIFREQNFCFQKYLDRCGWGLTQMWGQHDSGKLHFGTWPAAMFICPIFSLFCRFKFLFHIEVFLCPILALAQNWTDLLKWLWRRKLDMKDQRSSLSQPQKKKHISRCFLGKKFLMKAECERNASCSNVDPPFGKQNQ